MFEKLTSGLSQAKNATKSNRTPNRGLRITNILHVIYRFLQIVFACVVIGYYAADLNRAHKVQKYTDSKWVFAVLVGALAAITAMVAIVIGIISGYHAVTMLFPWEWILVILWSALCGLFGVMYRTENAEMDAGIERMKTAFQFDCVNLAFWGVSAIIATIMFFEGRRSGAGGGGGKKGKSSSSRTKA